MRTRCKALLLLATAAAALSTAAGSTASAARIAVQPQHSLVAACGRDYYKSSSGRCVHRPSSSPSGATARCRDGSYSYSQHASGTCSHHGGVGRWIHHP